MKAYVAHYKAESPAFLPDRLSGPPKGVQQSGFALVDAQTGAVQLFPASETHRIQAHGRAFIYSPLTTKIAEQMAQAMLPYSTFSYLPSDRKYTDVERHGENVRMQRVHLMHGGIEDPKLFIAFAEAIKGADLPAPAPEAPRVLTLSRFRAEYPAHQTDMSTLIYFGFSVESPVGERHDFPVHSTTKNTGTPEDSREMAKLRFLLESAGQVFDLERAIADATEIEFSTRKLRSISQTPLTEEEMRFVFSGMYER